MPLRYLLDTNICIYIKRKRPPQVRERMARLNPSSVAMSLITWGELLCGLHRSQSPDLARATLQQIAASIPVLPLPAEAAEHYGAIRATLAARGAPIGANDLWIAAHARAAKLTVVTNNTREFERVPGLKVENWVE